METPYEKHMKEMEKGIISEAEEKFKLKSATFHANIIRTSKSEHSESFGITIPWEMRKKLNLQLGSMARITVEVYTEL